MTIYGQSWGRAARGAALPGSVRPQRQRAGQGASGPRSPSLGPPPPRPARPAPPFGPCPRLGLGPSDLRRGRPRGSCRARRGNKWARMPYEISKCRAPVPPGWAPALLDPSAIVGAWAARPSLGARGAGDYGRRSVSAPPPSGATGGDPAPWREAKLAFRAGPGAASASPKGPAGIVDQEVARSPALLQSGGHPSGWRQQVTG